MRKSQHNLKRKRLSGAALQARGVQRKLPKRTPLRDRSEGCAC